MLALIQPHDGLHHMTIGWHSNVDCQTARVSKGHLFFYFGVCVLQLLSLITFLQGVISVGRLKL